MQNVFENLLTGYAESVGLDAQQLLAQRPANLLFDDKLNIQVALDEPAGEVCFASWLFSVEDEQRLAVIALMIAQANFEQDGLYGAHLAMNTEGKVVLLRRVPLQSLDAVRFDNQVKEFVDAAEQWTDAVASMVAFAADETFAADSGETGDGRGLLGRV